MYILYMLVREQQLFEILLHPSHGQSQMQLYKESHLCVAVRWPTGTRWLVWQKSE